MARTQVVTYSFSCDVCGNPIPDSEQAGAATQVEFARTTYQLDLCKKDRTGLAKAVAGLQAYLDAGQAKAASRSRSAGSSRRRPAATGRRRGRSAARSSADVDAVREWARANGYQVSDRGRIAQAVRDAYSSANA